MRLQLKYPHPPNNLGSTPGGPPCYWASHSVAGPGKRSRRDAGPGRSPPGRQAGLGTPVKRDAAATVRTEQIRVTL
eukprot:763141-Hanusia_phi.AAC.4